MPDQHLQVQVLPGHQRPHNHPQKCQQHGEWWEWTSSDGCVTDVLLYAALMFPQYDLGLSWYYISTCMADIGPMSNINIESGKPMFDSKLSRIIHLGTAPGFGIRNVSIRVIVLISSRPVSQHLPYWFSLTHHSSCWIYHIKQTF